MRCCRKKEMKSAAHAQFCIEADPTTVLACGSIGAAQSQPGSLTRFFCCKKRFEEMGFGVIVDAGASVLDGKPDIQLATGFDSSRSDGHAAARFSHRIPGIHREAYNDLLYVQHIG